ncbi:MAG: DNA-processing protein DprA [Clostridia bacterium]|nr:DNA-processing protein DprA [Clostridia bacterium]
MTDLITIKNLLTLQQAFGVGSNKCSKAFNKLCDLNRLGSDLSKCGDIFDKGDIDRINKVDKSVIDKIIEDSNNNGIKIITVCDKEFPDRLRNIPTPPILLFVLGDLPDIDNEPLICIVGPRKPSEFGKKAAYSLSYRLAKAGMTVVSGAAIGCDSYAHNGALKAGGKTIGVLGCGILSDYLPIQRELRRKIAENCCLISELPPRDNGSKFSFPIRNRIMSGLCLGVIVVEAGEKSGALNTAKHANDQGRDVFVIPGNPTLECYKGSNALLRDGARPLIDTSDIFGEYIGRFADKIDIERAFAKQETKNDNKKFTKKVVKSLSKSAEILYNYLDNQKFTADDLTNCDLSYDEILSSLTELEIAGYIKSLPGGIYVTI